MERIPPHNEEAERSVLGAAMLTKDALYDILEQVRPADFYSNKHKEIFEAITALHQRSTPVDALTVSEELSKRSSLEMVGGRAYIASLSMSVPTAQNAGSYAKIIAEKATLRRLISAATEIIEKGYQEKMESEQVLDFAERSIFEIAQQRQNKEFMPLKDVLMENLANIDKAAQMDGGITGVSSGFLDLDALTSGFQRSDLIILAARPAMGKTAFALNVAQQASLKAGATVMIFSMEMSKEQLGQRFLAIESRVELTKLKTGRVEDNWPQIYEAMDQLSKTNIYIDDTPGISMMEIKNKCRRLKAEKGLDLILVDYLQLMNYEGRSESRQQEITALSRAFKQLARELDCPVILLSQLSRAPEQRGDAHKRPQLSDLRESGAIEQDADIVLFLYRDDYYFKETTEKPNICEVIIAKHRSGPTGTVDLAWIDKYTKFADSVK